MEKDPVCGMLMDPRQAAGQRRYQGQIYHFCSLDCLAKFDQAPARYAEREAEKEK
ncbi:MAG: YHS domain-containing protein [Pseudomonadota bacterium]